MSWLSSILAWSRWVMDGGEGGWGCETRWERIKPHRSDGLSTWAGQTCSACQQEQRERRPVWDVFWQSPGFCDWVSAFPPTSWTSCQCGVLQRRRPSWWRRDHNCDFWLLNLLLLKKRFLFDFPPCQLFFFRVHVQFLAKVNPRWLIHSVFI